MSKLKTFTITAQEQISQWQNVTYVVEATSEADAQRKIKESPQEHCINVDEIINDTEAVLVVDFKSENYTCEES